MKASAYASLRATFDRVERLPAGPERSQAVEELRATLRTLRGEEARQLLAEAHRFLQGADPRGPARHAQTRTGWRMDLASHPHVRNALIALGLALVACAVSLLTRVRDAEGV
jgi:hypothetical protein